MDRLLIATSLVLAACASSAPKEPAAPAQGHMAATDAPNPRRITHPEPGVTCEEVTPTGSLHARRVCRSDAERQQDRQFIQNQMLDPSSRGNCDGAETVCPVNTGVAGRQQLPGTPGARNPHP
jgi:hypothetical protein